MRYGRREEEGKKRSTFGYAQQVIRFAEGVETSRISFPDPVHRYPTFVKGRDFGGSTLGKAHLRSHFTSFQGI